jgi:uncharacterized Fe-S cluster protein YjdI/CDGSH-type Zn-finger protein
VRRLQSYTGNGVTVTFDPNLCWHSAECLEALPSVFDVGRTRWIRPEAAGPEAVRAAVAKCPSGALQFAIGEGEGAEPVIDAPAGVSIRLSENGPLMIEGALALMDENEQPVHYAGRCSLCRRGGTSNPPFCDGTHRKTGWKPKTNGGNE